MATALISCLVLAVSYVGSLYTTNSSLPRDHPSTIKQRMLRVSIVCIVGPIFVYLVADQDTRLTFFRHLGINLNNIGFATLLPLSLTTILFAGPIILYLLTEGIEGIREDIITIEHFSDLKWYRTVVVAPISEELIFRACMMPLLVPVYGVVQSIFIAPLFFGVAHFHHIWEEIKKGNEVSKVLLVSCFQFLYTTVFGIYSAFIFLRTGNIMGPILCHSFCNMIGFPDFGAVPHCKNPLLVGFMFILGSILFSFLLFPLTSPYIHESIYWS